MGNHDVGRAFTSGADLFWAAVTPETTPSKDLTLRCLDAIGERYRGADAEFDDSLFDEKTPLGRMVAIAFDMTSDEAGSETDDFEAWFMGPCRRFRDRYGFC